MGRRVDKKKTIGMLQKCKIEKTKLIITRVSSYNQVLTGVHRYSSLLNKKSP